MYNKLFTKILDSTIWLAPDTDRLVWITLIAAMDEDSIARFASIENLAIRARVSIDACKSAVRAFESPDPYGLHQDNEGRRIERIPDGWLILNGQKYREIVTKIVSRERTRERTKKWREKKAAALGDASNVTVTVGDGLSRLVTPSEAYAEAEAISETKKLDRRTACADTFDEIRQAYPKRSGGQRWGDAQKHYAKRLQEGYSHEVMLAGIRRYATWVTASGKDRTEHVLQAATFLGENRSFLEPYDLPKKPESEYDRMMRLNTPDRGTLEHEPERPALTMC